MKMKWLSFFVVFLSMRCLADARVSSPGNVTFSSPNGLNTTAIFDSTGTFVLQLASFDGAKTSTKTVTVIVTAPPPPVLPRVCVGNGSAIAGNGVDVGLAFSTGTLAVAGMQFDLALPAGVSSNTITAGLATLNAGKSIQANLVGSALRVIIFGLNQTAIDSGFLGTVNLRLAASLSSGALPLTLSGVIGTDAAGIGVAMTNCNATLTVTANQAPALTVAPSTQTIVLPAIATITGSSTDDGAPNPPNALTFTWSVL